MQQLGRNIHNYFEPFFLKLSQQMPVAEILGLTRTDLQEIEGSNSNAEHTSRQKRDLTRVLIAEWIGDLSFGKRCPAPQRNGPSNL